MSDHEAFAEIDQRLSALEGPAGRPAAAGKPPSPVRWETLDDAETATTWAEVWDFARWLAGRYDYDYDRTILPDCWMHHGFAVEEITALWTARLTAFHPDAGGDQPLWWHEALARLADRLRERFESCSSGCNLEFSEHRRPGWVTGQPVAASSSGRPSARDQRPAASVDPLRTPSLSVGLDAEAGTSGGPRRERGAAPGPAPPGRCIGSARRSFVMM